MLSTLLKDPTIFQKAGPSFEHRCGWRLEQAMIQRALESLGMSISWDPKNLLRFNKGAQHAF